MQIFNKIGFKKLLIGWSLSLLFMLFLQACDDSSPTSAPVSTNPATSRAFAAYFQISKLYTFSAERVVAAATAATFTATPVPATPTDGSLAVALGTLNAGRPTPSPTATAAARSGSPTADSTLAALSTLVAGGQPGAVTTPPAAANPNPIASQASVKAEIRSLLGPLWQTYKNRYIQDDGRVKDPQRTDASTSEGQSYALLRAYWMDDRATFDNALNWSISNLQTPRGDKLFAYLWGKNSDGSWKIIDQNVATDADQDIAFALIMAAQKWNEPRYTTLAQQILADLWTKTVVTINGKPYLTAGDWSPLVARPVLNPSYLAPYAFRLFAQADPDKSHNWAALVDTSYEVLKGCTESKLDTAEGKLPPNWCAIDRQTNSFFPASQSRPNLDSDYGYDAFRAIWRVALDYRWNNEPRALSYLQSLSLLRDEYKSKQKLGVVYDHAGQLKNNGEDAGIYGGSALPLFLALDQPLADQLVVSKLLPVARDVNQGGGDPASGDGSKARTYYSQNWTWFGLAFYVDALPRPNPS